MKYLAFILVVAVLVFAVIVVRAILKKVQAQKESARGVEHVNIEPPGTQH